MSPHYVALSIDKYVLIKEEFLAKFIKILCSFVSS